MSALSSFAVMASGRLASVLTNVRAVAARIRDLVRRLPSPLPWLVTVAESVRRIALPLAATVAALTGRLAAAASARPLKVLMLSLAALATGGLGIMVAYAATPDGAEGQILMSNGETYTIATVTGPGGTTTVAVTKTKEGKKKLVPVRITRTVDGPGNTEQVFVDVVGEPIVLTETDTRLITQIATQMATQTQVVTEIRPVTQTQVVTQPVTETVVVTETQKKKETETVTETVVVTETVPVPP